MKRRNITKYIFVIAIQMFIIVSCEYDHPEPIFSDGTPVSFSNDIQAIFDAGCNGLGCHSAASIPPDLTAANAYNSLFENDLIDTINYEDSELYQQVNNSGSMNVYLTNANDASQILNWIKQGAKNN